MKKRFALHSRSIFVGLTSFLVIMIAIVALHKSPCFQVFAYSCSQLQANQVDDSTELAPGYKIYSPQTLAEAQQHGKVVLYFWAPWCSTCTSLDIELQDKKQTIPEGVTVLRINYDQSSELKRKYNIVTQHTFVQIDNNGNELSTWVGGEIDNFAKYLQ